VARRLHPIRRKLVFAADRDHIVGADGPARFELASDAQLDELAALSHETSAELRAMRERLARGDWCIAGRVDGALALYGWSMFGEMEIGEHLAPLRDELVYSYKLFTAPPFRGRRIASSYYSFLASELGKRPPVRRVVATVVATNAASIALHRRCGFAAIGSIVEIRGGGACAAFPDANVKRLFR